MLKKWTVKEVNQNEVKRLCSSFGISSPLATALCGKEFSDDGELKEFVECKKTDFDFTRIPDIEKGAARVLKAIDCGERIAVYGDYDADGITATAVMYSYLEGIGADVVWYIPNRMTEGYGMNCAAIDTLKDSGVQLILTIDNGISSVKEVEYAGSLGITTVITDHHKVSADLPDAAAVINPQRHDCDCFKELAGVGVAFAFVCVMEQDIVSMLEQYSDLVSIGTIADVVPLTGINRVILKYGIELINNRSNAGLSSLLEISGNTGHVDFKDLSFTAIPRINASGRMGDAGTALRLLLAEDDEEAKDLAIMVDSENKRRQETEAAISADVKDIIDKNRLYEKDVLVVAKEGWHSGVLGIVSAKVSETFGKPCILFSISGDEAIGSGRSPENFPLFDALKSTEDILVRFGGHKSAAGVTLKTDLLGEFSERINNFAKEHTDSTARREISICGTLSCTDINLSSVRELDMMKPFGCDNPEPLFLIKNLVLDEIYSIGDGKHSRFKFHSGNFTLYAVCFSQSKESFVFKPGTVLDGVFTLDINSYQGKESVSYKLRDIRPSDFNDTAYMRSAVFAMKIKNNEVFSDAEKAEFNPTRPDLISVYSYISKYGFSSCADNLAFILSLPFGKVFAAITAFCEVGLMKAERVGNDISLSVIPTDKKVDINSSPILKKF